MRFLEQHSTFCLTIILVALAHLATEIVVSDQSGNVMRIMIRFTIIALLTGCLLGISMNKQWKSTGATFLLALMATLGPLLTEPLWRSVFNMGHPLEIQLLIGFRNLSLVCLVWSREKRFEVLAAVISLFATIFCVSSSIDHSLVPISLIYLGTGVGWLCCNYWSKLNIGALSEDRRTIPSGMIAFVAILLLSSLLLVSVPSEARMRMVEGILPSSGGTGDKDSFARSGVGDGDAFVAATKEAHSFAPLENAPFIESNQPSLYDMFQDTYGEPKPPKKMQRAIALAPELVTLNHEKMVQSKKASKTFQIERQPPRQSRHRHLEDTESPALLHLVGRVPAHLRHTTYDLFDGYEWYPESVNQRTTSGLSVETIDDKPWICCLNSTTRFFGEHVEKHTLKVLNVETNRILAPTNLRGVHIDRCDREDLFCWEQPDILAMDRDSLPSLTVIQVCSHLVDPEFIDEKLTHLRSGLPEYRTLPEGMNIEQLARKWTSSAESDWERVRLIQQRLRRNYHLDEEIAPPDDCKNPVWWFLNEKKAGPDYLFATSAVMLCRSLGISTRAVSGFYADPDKFDYSTQQTSVYPSDVHWWAEVSLGGGSWATLEVTPGYEQPVPPRSLWAQTILLLSKGCHLAISCWPVTGTLCVLFALCIHQRKQIESQFLIWSWLLRHSCHRSISDPRSMIIEAARTLDHKLATFGKHRPAHQSIAHYLRNDPSTNSKLQITDDEKLQFSQLIDWATYSQEPALNHFSYREARDACRKMVCVRRRKQGASAFLPYQRMKQLMPGNTFPRIPRYES